ncbi:acetylcholinesterase-like [Dermacentor variabilis]|uniref:acetylcholinesterase-like n=1 Tax=Dermacentor variabilis TaxID=34621 RepID=UPI003F5B278C
MESHDKAEQRTYICGPKTKILLLTVAGVTLVIIATAVVTAVKSSSPRDGPVISGHFGAVRGLRLVVSDQDRQWTVLAFLGVPFAKAPRGELRFKPPQPLATPVGKDQREWALDTWTKRPPCPQQDFYLGHEAVNTSNATEDCLHLNIWAPASSCVPTKEQEACELRTVLFFIYGAAFQNGGNNFEARSHALRRPIPVCPWQPGRGRAELPRGAAGLSGQPRGDEFSRKLGPARPTAGARMDASQHRLLRRQRVASGAGGPRRRRDVPGLPPVQRRHGVLDAERGSLHTAERRTVPQATGLKGKQFLLGRVACEGAYPWFVEQRHTGTGDPQQIATLLLGHKEIRRWQNDSGVHRGRILLERWQKATGISLSLVPGRRIYQEAVGDILEVCPMSELAEQLYAWHNRVHVYELGYRPSYSSWLSENGAVHFEDMELVFGMPLRPGVVSSDLDKAWSRTMIHVWATFARTGQPPAVHNLSWPRYDSTLHTIMKLGPQDVTEQAETKRKRCNLMRDTSAPY